ncbi:MAG TPA: hypothetical protein O0X42_03300, partial [Methanocorpusculum sp.]|nr:hypothetical protein [Methanocorpusculum sp.]
MKKSPYGLITAVAVLLLAAVLFAGSAAADDIADCLFEGIAAESVDSESSISALASTQMVDISSGSASFDLGSFTVVSGEKLKIDVKISNITTDNNNKISITLGNFDQILSKIDFNSVTIKLTTTGIDDSSSTISTKVSILTVERAFTTLTGGMTITSDTEYSGVKLLPLLKQYLSSLTFNIVPVSPDASIRLEINADVKTGKSVHPEISMKISKVSSLKSIPEADMSLVSGTSSVKKSYLLSSVGSGQITAKAKPESVHIGDSFNLSGTADFRNPLSFFISGTEFGFQPITGESGGYLTVSGNAWNTAVNTSLLSNSSGKKPEAGEYTIYAAALTAKGRENITKLNSNDMGNIDYVITYAAVPVTFEPPLIVSNITVTAAAGGTASASAASAVTGTVITLTAVPDTDYKFKEWQVVSGGVAVVNNQFTMPACDVEIDAVFEKILISANKSASIVNQTTPENLSNLSVPLFTNLKSGKSIPLNDSVVVKAVIGGVEQPLPAKIVDGKVQLDDPESAAGADSLTVEFIGRKLGDSDSDGNVTVNDAVRVAQSLVKIVTLDDKGRFYGDTDSDGNITVNDAVKVAQRL